MFDSGHITQPLLLRVDQNCSSCPLRNLGLCRETPDSATCGRGDDSEIGCHEPRRIGRFVEDLFMRPPSNPHSYNHEKLEIPRVVYSLTKNQVDRSSLESEGTVYGITLTILLKNGKPSFIDRNNLVETLRLPKNARLALIGTSSESTQQAFWRNIYSERLIEYLANFGFEWTTSTSFPVWDYSPRADQIIFQQRNYIVSDSLASLGVPVVPFVYPYNETDYSNFGRWIERRPSIRYVAVHATYYKHQSHLRQLLINMRHIQDSAKRRLRFLVVGVNADEKIRMVMQEFPDVSMVNSSVHSLSAAGEDLRREKRLEMSKTAVWSQNQEEFERKLRNNFDPLI